MQKTGDGTANSSQQEVHVSIFEIKMKATTSL
jgi:hypothetical protein